MLTSNTQPVASAKKSTIPLPLVTITFAICLTCFHVHVEGGNVSDDNDNMKEKMGFFKRLGSGPEYLTTMDNALLCCIVLLAFELMVYLSDNIGGWLKCKSIPVRGKHLDDLSTKDNLFITISRAQNATFVYFLFRFCFHGHNIVWSLKELNFTTAIVPYLPLFIIFDFFYTILHWALHIKSIYGYIHKHHHHQKAPSRGNIDAINVHPIEYLLGEYNHIWSIYIWCSIIGMEIHVVCILLFVAVGGVLAGLNHTRYDIVVKPFFGITLFDTKYHDVHHRIPQSNYGQYTAFWDHVFGTFRPYDAKDRVNPQAQLNPKTGKSMNYGKYINLKEQ